MKKLIIACGIACIMQLAFCMTKDEFGTLKRKAEGGDAESMCELGWCYRYGDGVAKDLSLASEWTLKAASKGQNRAKGMCCQFGYNTQTNLAQAFDLYRKAVKDGNALARLDVSHCYEFGIGVEKDFRQALKHCSGPATYYNVGRLAELGKYGHKPTMGMAVKMYRMAAKNGNANAIILIDLLKDVGADKDFNKVVECYRTAAEKGNAIAMFALANRYKEGIGVDKDDRVALDWYRKAIDAKLAGECLEIAIYNIEEIETSSKAVATALAHATALKNDTKKYADETLVMKKMYLGMPREDALTLCAHYLGARRGTEIVKSCTFEDNVLAGIVFSRSDVDKLFSVSGISCETFVKKLIEAYPIIGEFEVALEEVPDTERQEEAKKSIEARWKARALNAGGGFDTGYNMAIEARGEYDRVKDSITKSAKVYRCENKKGFLLEIHEGLPDSFLSLKKIGVVKDSNFD